MKKSIVGYTTGVFDLFHIGHLNILKKAKEHCDYLIVGVSTNRFVEQYKKKSPIICFEERLEIVKAIKYVDEVVPQESQDKMDAWKKYRFDKMFVGDDWKNTPQWIKYEEDFAKVDVEIIYFPYTAGRSSTKLNQVLEKFLNTKN